MKNSRILFSLLFAALFSTAQAAETYVADPAHSSVQFRISHFFSKVPGRFGKFSATMVVDRDNMENSTAKAEIDMASIDTNQEARDKDLRSPGYFDVAKFPKMTFESKSWKNTGESQFDVSGDLTLHGITRPVVLKVRSLGFGKGMKGSSISGWEGATQIKRSDFGITSGSPVVGDDVDIEINLEAKKS